MDLPIIYVRGFAGSTSGIDKAVDDPFYGFNEGAVHVRVGKDSTPRFYQFESPMLRLITEQGYRLLVHGSQEAYLDRAADGSIEPNTIWVHRFYDEAASTFGREPEAYALERAAQDLFELVQKVCRKTGAPRVHLVAHSMGGLICRSMIQRFIPELSPRVDGRLRLDAAADHVERLFTYGTPHGGIEFGVGLGLVEKARDLLNVNGAEIFGPERMFSYLTPREDPDVAPERPDDWDPRSMPDDGFPVARVFCLVGTNPEDYGVALGLSSKVVGARSDGLVQIDNAYVPGAHRAFVHRSHSGRYGLVNSEEGYQNLRRFLFGDLEVRVELRDRRVRGDADDDIVWQLETQVSIRGLPIVMHEQTTAHHCPVQIEWRPREDTADTPVPLLTTFLSTGERPRDDGGDMVRTVRHALRLRLLSIREKGGIFGFFDHLEQTADFDDTLIVDFLPPGAGAGARAWAVWNSQLAGAIRDWRPAESDAAPIQDEENALGVWRGRIPVPETGRTILGENATIVLTVIARAPAGP
jgi:hypothetical protein